MTFLAGFEFHCTAFSLFFVRDCPSSFFSDSLTASDLLGTVHAFVPLNALPSPNVSESVLKHLAVVFPMLASLIPDTYNPFRELTNAAASTIPLTFRNEALKYWKPEVSYSGTSVISVSSSAATSTSSATVAASVGSALSRLRCIVSGEIGEDFFERNGGNVSHRVTCSHIIPHRVSAASLKFIGISRAEVNSPRNSLWLGYHIEKAFDRLDISFICTLNFNQFVVKIWNPDIRKQVCFYVLNMIVLLIFLFHFNTWIVWFLDNLGGCIDDHR
jgi:hypothetical protein